MLKGLLLYTEEDARKNQWFTEHLINIAKSYDINLILHSLRNKDEADEGLFEGMDFCINRTRFFSVNFITDKLNIRCYNKWESVKIFNDKWFTYLLCNDMGIPTVDTVKIDDSRVVPFDFPIVVKSRNGHGGSEVFRIDSEQELQDFEFSNPAGYIAQQFASEPGTDVRIYVLGNEPVAAVKRTSLCDFRSNFSLGGKAELFTPTEEQLSIIKKLRSVIPTDYAGFDFIRDNGRWVLNEVEDTVGSRMLYSLCDFDIGERFIEYISEDLNSQKG